MALMGQWCPTTTKRMVPAVPHALASTITSRMDELGLRQRDVVTDSGLSRALVSKYVSDSREKLTRLPDRQTLEGLAKGLRLPVSVLLAKAVESLDLGYIAGDFINAVSDADDVELLLELALRLDRAHVAEGGTSFQTPAVVHSIRDLGRATDEATGRVDEVAAHDEAISIQEEQGHPDTP